MSNSEDSTDLDYTSQSNSNMNISPNISIDKSFDSPIQNNLIEQNSQIENDNESISYDSDQSMSEDFSNFEQQDNPVHFQPEINNEIYQQNTFSPNPEELYSDQSTSSSDEFTEDIYDSEENSNNNNDFEWRYVPIGKQDETLRFNQRLMDNIERHDWTRINPIHDSTTVLFPESKQKEAPTLNSTNSSNLDSIFSVDKNTNLSIPFKLETVGSLKKRKIQKNTNQTKISDLLNFRISLTEKEIGIGVSNQMFILSSETGSHISTIKNEKQSQAISFSKNSLFLAYGDSSGTLYILQNSTKKLLFTHKLQNTDIFNTKENEKLNGIEKTKTDTNSSLEDIKESPTIGNFVALRFISNINSRSEELIGIYTSKVANILVRFSNLLLTDLDESLSNNDINRISEIKQSIKIEIVSLNNELAQFNENYENPNTIESTQICKVTDMALLETNNELCIYISSTGKINLSVWSRNNNGITNCKEYVSSSICKYGYSQLGISSSEKYLLALYDSDEENGIDIYDSKSLILIKRYDGLKAKEMVVLSHEGWIKQYSEIVMDKKNNLSKDKFLGAKNQITNTTNSNFNIVGNEKQSQKSNESIVVVLLSNEIFGKKNKSRVLTIASLLPNVKKHFSTQVSSESSLARDLRGSGDLVEAIAFIEGIRNRREDQIYLRVLIQSAPIERFRRLLNGKQYEKAIGFAQIHGIDSSDVYISMMADLLENSEITPIESKPDNKPDSIPENELGIETDKLECSSKNISDILLDTSLENIISCAEKIQNESIVLDFLFGLGIADEKTLKLIIEYAKSRSTSEDSKEKVKKIEIFLGTFILISEDYTKLAYSKYENTDFSSCWSRFRSSSLQQLVCDFVKNKFSDHLHLHSALKIWERHLKSDEDLHKGFVDTVKLCPVSVDSKLFKNWIQQVFKLVDNVESWGKLCTWVCEYSYNMAIEIGDYKNALLILEEVFQQHKMRNKAFCLMYCEESEFFLINNSVSNRLPKFNNGKLLPPCSYIERALTVSQKKFEFESFINKNINNLSISKSTENEKTIKNRVNKEKINENSENIEMELNNLESRENEQETDDSNDGFDELDNKNIFSSLINAYELSFKLIDLEYLYEKYNLEIDLSLYEQLNPNEVSQMFFERIDDSSQIHKAYYQEFLPFIDYWESERPNRAFLLRKAYSSLKVVIDVENNSIYGSPIVPEKVVLDYCIDYMNAPSIQKQKTMKNQWEDRVVALYHCLSHESIDEFENIMNINPSHHKNISQENNGDREDIVSERIQNAQIELALEIMRRARIPWSWKIESVCQKTLETVSKASKSPEWFFESNSNTNSFQKESVYIPVSWTARKTEVQEQYRLMLLKMVLQFYRNDHLDLGFGNNDSSLRKRRTSINRNSKLQDNFNDSYFNVLTLSAELGATNAHRSHILLNSIVSCKQHPFLKNTVSDSPESNIASEYFQKRVSHLDLVLIDGLLVVDAYHNLNRDSAYESRTLELVNSCDHITTIKFLDTVNIYEANFVVDCDTDSSDDSFNLITSIFWSIYGNVINFSSNYSTILKEFKSDVSNSGLNLVDLQPISKLKKKALEISYLVLNHVEYRMNTEIIDNGKENIERYLELVEYAIRITEYTIHLLHKNHNLNKTEWKLNVEACNGTQNLYGRNTYKKKSLVIPNSYFEKNSFFTLKKKLKMFYFIKNLFCLTKTDNQKENRIEENMNSFRENLNSDEDNDIGLVVRPQEIQEFFSLDTCDLINTPSEKLNDKDIEFENNLSNTSRNSFLHNILSETLLKSKKFNHLSGFPIRKSLQRKLYELFKVLGISRLAIDLEIIKIFLEKNCDYTAALQFCETITSPNYNYDSRNLGLFKESKSKKRTYSEYTQQREISKPNDNKEILEKLQDLNYEKKSKKIKTGNQVETSFIPHSFIRGADSSETLNDLMDISYHHKSKRDDVNDKRNKSGDENQTLPKAIIIWRLITGVTSNMLKKSSYLLVQEINSVTNNTANTDEDEEWSLVFQWSEKEGSHVCKNWIEKIIDLCKLGIKYSHGVNNLVNIFLQLYSCWNLIFKTFLRTDSGEYKDLFDYENSVSKDNYQNQIEASENSNITGDTRHDSKFKERESLSHIKPKDTLGASLSEFKKYRSEIYKEVEEYNYISKNSNFTNNIKESGLVLETKPIMHLISKLVVLVALSVQEPMDGRFVESSKYVYQNMKEERQMNLSKVGINARKLLIENKHFDLAQEINKLISSANLLINTPKNLLGRMECSRNNMEHDFNVCCGVSEFFKTDLVYLNFAPCQLELYLASENQLIKSGSFSSGTKTISMDSGYIIPIGNFSDSEILVNEGDSGPEISTWESGYSNTSNLVGNLGLLTANPHQTALLSLRLALNSLPKSFQETRTTNMYKGANNTIFKYPLNTDYILSLIMSIPKKLAYSELKLAMENSYNNHTLLNQLAHMGVICAKLWDEKSILEKFKKILLASKWEQRFEILGFGKKTGILQNILAYNEENTIEPVYTVSLNSNMELEEDENPKNSTIDSNLTNEQPAEPDQLQMFYRFSNSSYQSDLKHICKNILLKNGLELLECSSFAQDFDIPKIYVLFILLELSLETQNTLIDDLKIRLEMLVQEFESLKNNQMKLKENQTNLSYKFDGVYGISELYEEYVNLLEKYAFVSGISPYNYEKILLILNFYVKSISENHLKKENSLFANNCIILLEVLKVYKRSNPPNLEELVFSAQCLGINNSQIQHILENKSISNDKKEIENSSTFYNILLDYFPEAREKLPFHRFFSSFMLENIISSYCNFSEKNIKGYIGNDKHLAQTKEFGANSWNFLPHSDIHKGKNIHNRTTIEPKQLKEANSGFFKNQSLSTENDSESSFGFDPWDVLYPELSVETISLLLSFALPLEISEDDFYINLVHSLLNNMLCHGEESRSSASKQHENQVYSKIEYLVSQIKNSESSIATAQHVAEQLPVSIEKTLAYRLCIKLLRKWTNSLKRSSNERKDVLLEKGESLVNILSSSLSNVQSLLLVKEYELSNCYFDLLNEVINSESGIESYIVHLYKSMDYGVTDDKIASEIRNSNENHQFYFISDFGNVERMHCFADTICSYYEENASTLRMQLLKDMLTEPIILDYFPRIMEAEDGTNTMLLPSCKLQLATKNVISHEFKLRSRIISILQAFSVESPRKLVMLLLKFAYEKQSFIIVRTLPVLGFSKNTGRIETQKSTKKAFLSSGVRLRALEILISVSTPTEISKVQSLSLIKNEVFMA
ncbi:hypothetical protein BB559_003695 [Furculomyces boomerangus]|uniref:RZZ complex subunit KNTC1/ROD C-terminal domain-containing protein n=1 Tax=Furculomyces boomerangus TaxID=61424 RepID=A0A2T9YJQ5_9FUNG|nr:hypothetical protein BB559_003695 [Furculomyces boomerangus]